MTNQADFDAFHSQMRHGLIMRMRKFLVTTNLLIILGLLISACSRSSSEGPQDENVDAGVGNSSELEHLADAKIEDQPDQPSARSRGTKSAERLMPTISAKQAFARLCWVLRDGRLPPPASILMANPSKVWIGSDEDQNRLIGEWLFIYTDRAGNPRSAYVSSRGDVELRAPMEPRNSVAREIPVSEWLIDDQLAHTIAIEAGAFGYLEGTEFRLKLINVAGSGNQPMWVGKTWAVSRRNQKPQAIVVHAKTGVPYLIQAITKSQAVQLRPLHRNQMGQFHFGVNSQDGHNSQGADPAGLTAIIAEEEGKAERLASSYNTSAVARMTIGDWTSAIDDFTKGLRIEPADRKLRFGRGLSHLLIRNFDHAQADFTELGIDSEESKWGLRQIESITSQSIDRFATERIKEDNSIIFLDTASGTFPIPVILGPIPLGYEMKEPNFEEMTERWFAMLKRPEAKIENYKVTLKMEVPAFYTGSFHRQFTTSNKMNDARGVPGLAPMLEILKDYGEWKVFFFYDEAGESTGLALGAKAMGPDGEYLADAVVVSTRPLTIDEFHFDSTGNLYFRCRSEYDALGFKVSERMISGTKHQEYFLVWSSFSPVHVMGSTTTTE